MEYINEFHKEWIERTRQSIASWSKQPISLEEKRKQQERLNQQRAIREGKQMMGFLGIGNNPMVGCTVACAVDVATALNK